MDSYQPIYDAVRSRMSGGNGRCVHKLTDEICPHCGMRMVKVTTTGFRFCSNHESACEYEYDPREKANEARQKTPTPD